MPSVDQSPEIARLKTKLGVELLWVYVLSLLKRKPSHAYVLRKKISKEFDFTPGNVSAYVVLYKLKSRGYVTSRKQGEKRIYSLTEKGNKLLKLAQKTLRETDKKLFS